MNDNVLNDRLVNLRSCLVAKFVVSTNDVHLLDSEFEHWFPEFFSSGFDTSNELEKDE